MTTDTRVPSNSRLVTSGQRHRPSINTNAHDRKQQRLPPPPRGEPKESTSGKFRLVIKKPPAPLELRIRTSAGASS